MQPVLTHKKTLNLRGRLLHIERPQVMGILNVTPDSFFAQSRKPVREQALRQAELMLKQGADLLDVGGYSTRPGALHVSLEQELERVVPVVELLSQYFPQAIVSVDTFRARVAREAVEAGALLVNDVSGGTLDADMLATVGGLQVPYVLMHMKGTPQDMQQHAQYEDVLREVMDFFVQQLEAFYAAGGKDAILDPGFGFAKTPEQNYALLNQLEQLQLLECPLLVGVSRKSMIWKRLGITAEEALNGTTVLNTIAVLKGASFLRVHDVKEARQVVDLLSGS